MKSLKKIIQIGGLVAALTIGGIYQRFDTIRNKAEECFLERIRLQEEVLGIKYDKKPKLKLEYNPDYPVITTFLYNMGQYVPSKETVYLPPLTIPNLILGDVENTIDHELGHHYFNILSERLGGDFPPTIGRRFINEGVAEYIKIKINDSNDNLPCYVRNFEFVKPIIDQYGEKGIEVLIERPPSDESLTEIPPLSELDVVNSLHQQDNYLRYLGQYN